MFGAPTSSSALVHYTHMYWYGTQYDVREGFPTVSLQGAARNAVHMGLLVALQGWVWGGAACHGTAVVSQVHVCTRHGGKVGRSWGWDMYRGGRDEIVCTRGVDIVCCITVVR